MIKFHEGLRYDLPLTRQSIVMDVGGYEGNFAYTIAKKYGCCVVIFEPVKEFYDNCVERMKGIDGIIFRNYGIACSKECGPEVKFKVSGDSTGAFSSNALATERTVRILPISTVMETIGFDNISLLKLNVEGAEFGILEDILDLRLAWRFENIQVQPHPIVPNYESRWKRICDRLAETHELVYAEPWCWFGWRLK